MNSGTQSTPAAVTEQQHIAADELRNYMHVQLPALGFAIRAAKEDEPGIEQRSADMAAQSGRVAGAQAQGQTIGRSFTGSLPGSGAFSSRYGGILPGAAAMSSTGATDARMGAKGNYLNTQDRIIGAGNQMLAQADRALVTEGGIAQGVANAQSAAQAQNQQAAAGLSIAALAAFL